MPTDNVLTDDVIAVFDEVRRFFEDHPDPACVALLLGALPDRKSSGFGVYQLLDATLAAQNREAVVRALRAALADRDSARTWMMELAVGYDDPELRSLAVNHSQATDEDLAFWARTYLEHHPG